jgi:diketogulonate reductase-like aldo/keto reductase
MRTIQLSNGRRVPALGLGTWHMGEAARNRAAEVTALKLGIDLGLSLIDTAEMYADGGAEEVVAEALAGRRDDVYLVSKVYPQNASRNGAVAACERSLRRLKTDHLDLYLLHWRGSVPLAETIDAFEHLKRDGKIGAWGVSNFDATDMAELAALTNGANCVVNQVLYHLGERGIEWDTLAACARANVMVMAYSPLGQGQLLQHKALSQLASKHAVSPAAIALAFVLRQPGVIAIPKATQLEHVRANALALTVQLDDADLAALDQAFSPPRRASPLAIL